MDIMKRIIDKCLSGRFILTIIGGGVFAYCAYKKMIEPAAISAIITMIFNSYFMRRDRNEHPK